MLEHLRQFCKIDSVMEPVDSTGRIDPYKMAFYNGQRTVAVMINRMLESSISEGRQEQAEHD